MNRWNKRWWLALGTAAWAVVLLVAAYASTHRDRPTVREQASVADARPAVDRAVTALVAAAGPAVVAVSPFRRVGTCRISVARDGERWEQDVAVYATAGGEEALLDRLARGLPTAYRATARKGRLRADGGDFVSLSGGPGTSGEVRITVATGCRTGTVATVAAAEPDPAVRQPVDAALAALGVSPARWSGFEVPCPAGGALHVATAESERGVVPGPLPATLMSIGPGAVVAEADVYAYRAGNSSVVVRVRDGVVSVTATASCR